MVMSACPEVPGRGKELRGGPCTEAVPPETSVERFLDLEAMPEPPGFTLGAGDRTAVRGGAPNFRHGKFWPGVGEAML